ncbi:MAG: hypothetical protein PHV02_09785 [Rhodocyclaceae bacterium]|nr:hypothetical protein [Rhodocyclaceae bacterium]
MFKAFLDVFETDEIDRFNDAEIVAMVTVVGVVVANDATVITRVDVVIDVGKVIASHFFAHFINPDFSAQFPIPALVGYLAGLIDDLYISYDKSYHA